MFIYNPSTCATVSVCVRVRACGVCVCVPGRDGSWLCFSAVRPLSNNTQCIDNCELNKTFIYRHDVLGVCVCLSVCVCVCVCVCQRLCVYVSEAGGGAFVGAYIFKRLCSCVEALRLVTAPPMSYAGRNSHTNVKILLCSCRITHAHRQHTHTRTRTYTHTHTHTEVTSLSVIKHKHC